MNIRTKFNYNEMRATFQLVLHENLKMIKSKKIFNLRDVHKPSHSTIQIS